MQVFLFCKLLYVSFLFSLIMGGWENSLLNQTSLKFGEIETIYQKSLLVLGIISDLYFQSQED
jgi:hypothetical protein